MTVRTPVYWDGSSIAQMSASQITTIKQRCVYLFGGAGRPVNLTYVASDGSLRRMLDTSDSPSAEVSNTRSFANNTTSLGNTTDAGTSTTYDHINQILTTPSDPTDTNNKLYPLYYDGSGNFQAMSKTDMYDTFINDAIDLLVDGNDRDGTYRLSTQPTTLANHTLVNANPIFVDTRFDKSIHGGDGSISEILPLSGTTTAEIEKWYLWRTNQGTSYGTPSVQSPLYINSDNDLQSYSTAEFDSVLEDLLFYSAASRNTYSIRYEVKGVSGTDTSEIIGNNSLDKTRGDVVTDTTLDSQVRINDQDADTYRSQNLPSGAGETETTYALKIYRT